MINKLTTRRFWRGTLIATALLSTTAFDSARAQAYCALRDPVQSINALYPKSTKYESIVRTVKGQARMKIKETLPFTLHFNELGRHTLYVVKQEETPLGMVHVRSEKGQWGLVEVVWALDMNLTVQGFRFQRCRNRQRKELESPAFTSQIIGKGLAEILPMLNAKGDNLNRSKIKVSEDGARLALAVLRSGLKTLAVTSEVWGEDLKKYQKKPEEEKSVDAVFERRAQAFFPEAKSFSPILKVYNEVVLQTLEKHEQQDEWVLERKTVKLANVLNEKDASIGLIMKTRCTAHENLVTVWWGVDAKGEISMVEPANKWPDDEFREAFAGLTHLKIEHLKSCSTAGQLAALEVMSIATGHVKP